MPDLAENARGFLITLGRNDLVTLLGNCTCAITEEEVSDGWFRDLAKQVIVRAPAPVDAALMKLPDFDRKRIAEAVTASDPGTRAPDDIRVETSSEAKATPSATLLAELVLQREIMISVATGGDRIQDFDDYYKAREARIRSSLPADAPYDNPYPGLWDWYNDWKARFPGWAARRQHVRALFGPAIEAVATKPSLTVPTREPTGWERVDRGLASARSRSETASAEEDWQVVGLLCREVIISLAQAVYRAEKHGTLDGVAPSPTDANRMLEAFVACEFAGSSNKEVRAHARAALGLALNLQHRRTATKRLAALCLEATASTVTVISIIARDEDPSY